MSIGRLGLFLAIVFFSVPSMAADKPAVKVAGGKNFAGASSVVVGSFSVAFITDKTDAAFAGSRIQVGVGKIAKSHLDGIGLADFQAITDAIYADFVQRMTAAGFTFIDRGTMLANKEAIADGEPDPEAAYAPVAGSDPTLAAIAKAATTMASLAVPKPQAPPVKTAAQIEADVAEARAVEVDTVAASIADDPGLLAQWAAVRQACAAERAAATRSAGRA